MTNQTLLNWIYQNKDKKSETEMKDELLKKGWKLEEVNDALDVAFQRKAETPFVSQPRPKKKRHWWAWGCLALIVIVITVVVIFVINVIKGIEELEKPAPEIAREEIIEEVETRYGYLGSEKYSVEERVTLTNEGSGNASKIDLWIALIQDIEPYQKVISQNITPEDYEIETDKEKNKFAKFEFQNVAPGEKLEIKASYQVEVNKIKSDLGDCQGETISSFKDSEKYIESDDPKIKNLASQLTQEKENDCQKATALYDYIGDNITYRGPIPENRGAMATLKTEDGDCSDFSDLFSALCRASGISSRTLEGVAYTEKDLKHGWNEIYFPGVGWTQVDSTWGRFENARQDHFARTDGKHIIITRGRKLKDREGLHYFFYNWYGSTKITHQEDWQMLPQD